MPKYLTAALYKFVSLPNFRDLQQPVLDACKKHHIKGTLLLKTQAQLHATMLDCGTHTLPFLNLLFKSFSNYDSEFSKLNSQRVQRFVGDLAYNGNGEILVMNN